MLAIKISSLIYDIFVATVSEFIIMNFNDHVWNWLEYLANIMTI